MKTTARSFFRLINAAVLLVTSVQIEIAQGAAPTTIGSENSTIEVREWVIFITDPIRTRSNARGDWASSLPTFMDSRRASGDETTKNRAAPIGVIRFLGKTDPKMPIDVVLTVNGEAETHWPKAQVKPHRLLWSNLVIDDATPELHAIEPTHWMAGLRRAESATVHTDKQAERFLLYDVETPYTAAIALRRADGEIFASNTSSQPLHDVFFYKKQGERWSQAIIREFPPAETRASTTKPSKNDPAAAFDSEIVKANPPTTASATHSTTAPTTQAAAATTAPSAPTTGTKVSLSPTELSDDHALLETWRPRLEEAGVMATDIDTILGILQTNALDTRWMTTVYRLDPAEMDRLLPIEIVPQPRKITRVGLVIVRNADPAIADDIDRLIQQCGDPDYDKRQEATSQLKSLGLAAKPKLEQAVKNKDVEIAQRAESILAAIAKPTRP